jgi:LysR family transcriptional regulator, glycine cleavage system transcriptional activator
VKFRHLPPLHALEAYSTAARELSFKKAAAALHLTPSAVSHQIKALEEFLGVELFQRGNRTLALTAAGRAYLKVVDESLGALQQASQRLRERYRRPRLKITIGGFMASEFLLPALPAFRAAHPSLELDIETDVRVRDLAEDNIDIAVRFGPGNWPGVRAIKLIDVAAEPVCAPALAPAKPTHAALGRLTRLESTPLPDAWEMWSKLSGVPLPPAKEQIHLDSYLAQLQAAERGLGVMLGLRPLIDRWLHKGKLVAPWNLAVKLPMSYYLLHRPGEEARPEVRVFLDWVREQLALHSLGWIS